MNVKKFSALLALGATVLAMLACSATQTEPTVSNIRMTTDASGKSSTSSYAPGDKFYIFADLSGIATGSVIEAKWYAVNAEGLDSNAELNTSDYTYESGVGYVYFELSTTDGSDWPSGSYRVELYLDGTKVGEQGFTVG